MADILTNTSAINSKLISNLGIQEVISGSVLSQLSETIAQTKTDQDTVIDRISVSNSILSATGQDLDDIGNNVFGVRRIKAQLSTATTIYKSVMFYVSLGSFGDINMDSSGTPQPIIVPEGTLISGSSSTSSYQFRVISQVTLNISDSQCFIPIELVNGDYQIVPTGSLKTHNFINYTQSASSLLLVTNSSPIVTGRDEETDDNYRYRIFTSQQSKSSLSTVYIQNEVQDLPGVSYCIVEPAAYSGGTFTVYVQGTTPTTSVETLDAVRSIVGSIIPPWSSDYYITTPNYIGLELGFNVTSSTTDTGTISLIQDIIATYINNFNGSQFTCSSLFSFVKGSIPNITNIEFAYIHIYSGDSSTYRTYDDQTSAGDAVIQLLNTDKLIIEPVPNAIEIYFITP